MGLTRKQRNPTASQEIFNVVLVLVLVFDSCRMFHESQFENEDEDET